MRIKITVCYDGTNYCGWQIQPNGMAVQQVLQDAIKQVFNESVTVTGSGRTDAGVHALKQVAHFDLANKNVPPSRIYLALNSVLPKDIRVTGSQKVNGEFNARKSAKQKTYRYNFYLSKVENPLLERYSERLEKTVDLKKIKSACEVFVGEHNFKAFSASGGSANTFTRTIYSIKAVKSGNKLYLEFTGSGFLYNMVRLLSGAILDVANGKITKEEINEMLKTGKRSKNIKTMPAKALTLYSVKYK